MLHRTIALTVALLSAQGLGSATPQTPGPVELAARMTGTWKLNRELSPGMAEPGGGREGRRGGLSLAAAFAAPQRGARGAGGDSREPAREVPFVTDAEAAAQAALGLLERVPLELTIEATPTQMRLIEARGPSVFLIDGKTTPVDVPGGTIKVKSRWDRASLRQEFSSAQRKLGRSWSVDSSHRLVLTQRFEGVSIRRRDSQATFDKQ
jgi:hypothetical protein